MAAKPTENTTETVQETPSEFPLTLVEFVAETKPIESAQAFSMLMTVTGEYKPRLRGEWKKQFDLFMRKPVDTDWKTWRELNQGGNK